MSEGSLFSLAAREGLTLVLGFLELYMSCHHSLGVTGATLNTRNASS